MRDEVNLCILLLPGQQADSPRWLRTEPVRALSNPRASAKITWFRSSLLLPVLDCGFPTHAHAAIILSNRQASPAPAHSMQLAHPFQKSYKCILLLYPDNHVLTQRLRHVTLHHLS